MKNLVIVKGIQVYAYHGCNDEEAVLGSKYVVDVEIETNFEIAAETDDLTKTIDYVTVREIVAEEMSVRSKLIEHVGNRIIKRIKTSFNDVFNAKVTVHKVNPPIGGVVEEVAVILEG